MEPWSGGTPAGPSRRPRQGGGALWRVRELLHDGFADDLSAEDLARAVGLSRFQLYRQFRERYGVASSAYLRQVRLREARRRLAAGAAIAEVACATGFANQSHLTRWFRRIYGITLRVYQQSRSVPAAAGKVILSG